MMFGKSSVVGLLVCLAANCPRAGEDGPKLAPLRAMASWEAVEVESFETSGNQTLATKDKNLSSNGSVWFLEEARLSENSKVFVGVGGLYFFILTSQGNQYSLGQRSAFGLTDLHGEFEYWRRGETDHGLLLKAGVFPYKYNEDAKNLGEYMFRTYTYPNIIFTGGLQRINGAGVQLNGLDANTKLGGLNNDLLLTLKTDQVPSGALSLTDIVSFTFWNFLTVGAGYMFDNFYDPTGVADGDRGFVKNPTGSDSKYYVFANGKKIPVVKYAYSQDSLGNNIYDPANVPVDSGQLSFMGQKAMGRVSLNFGKLIGSPMFSEHDLCLYFEGILMGVQNRPLYYDTLEHRIAYMVGFNFPTFHVLDLLSAEMEYFQNPYADEASNATIQLSPTPLGTAGSKTKWTVYARKNVYPGFSISAQAARDHLRLVDFYGHTNDLAVLPHAKNWYWAVQLGYSI